MSNRRFASSLQKFQAMAYSAAMKGSDHMTPSLSYHITSGL